MIHVKKLEQLLACFLYERQYLQIPDLGTFRLTEAFDAEAVHKQGSIPPGSITFTWNPKEKVDEELVAYVMKETGKMKSLAIADLSTLAAQAKEMLNIRQPFTLEGVGTLHMDPKGGVALGGRTVIAKVPVAARHESHTEASSHDIEPSSEKTAVHPGTLLAVSGIFILLALTAYFYFFRHPSSTPFLFPQHKEETGGLKELPDAVSPDPTEKEAAVQTTAPDNGMIQYEVVFETSHRTRALERYEQLTSWGHHITLSTKDSVMFTLAVPFTTLPEDTTSMKDSIQIQYGRPVYIRYR